MHDLRSPCECGCGGFPKGAKSRFLPGHDAKRSVLEQDQIPPQVLRQWTSWHVGVAAEALAAAQFARCGFDVSVQYGANQPEYDLIVARDSNLLKVSVKGSKDGSWGLTQSYLKEAKYHDAIDRWLVRHGSKTVFCFVQFKDVPLVELPRIYIATALEVAERLRATAKGRGDTILYENHTWGSRAVAAGTVERLPDRWRFTGERIEELLGGAAPDLTKPG